jgi:hypothetical protein
MSDLRERIAALLIAHPDLMSGKCCGAMEFDHQDQWAVHLADVLIRELPELSLIGQVFAPGHTITVTNVPPPKTLRDPDMIAADHPKEAE